MVKATAQGLALAVLLSLAGCGENFVQIEVQLLVRSCPGADGQQLDALAQVSHLEFTVTGDGIDPPLNQTVAVDTGTVALEGIPIGAAGQPPVTRKIEVKAHFQTADGPITAVGGAVIAMSADDPGPHRVPIFMRPVESWVYTNGAEDPDTCTRMERARAGHTATVLNDGRVLVAGGAEFDAAGGRKVHDSVELFDPITGTFELRVKGSGGLNQPRTFHTATKLQDGRVLLAGGEFDQLGGGRDVLRPAEVFDPAADAFGAPAVANLGRTQHTATRIGDGLVLVAGGVADPDPPAGDPQPLKSTEVFLESTSTFVVGPDLPEAKAEHCATTIRDGAVAVIAGGKTLNGANVEVSGKVYFFSSTGGVVSPISQTGVPLVHDLATPRYELSCSSLGPRNAEVAMFAGGYTRLNDFGATSAHSGIERFDPAGTPPVAEAGILSSARGRMCEVTLDEGTVVYVGGFNFDDPEAMGKTERLTRDATGAFAVQPTTGRRINDSRFHHACVRLLDGSILVTGGRVTDGASFPSTRTAELFTPQPSP